MFDKEIDHVGHHHGADRIKGGLLQMTVGGLVLCDDLEPDQPQRGNRVDTQSRHRGHRRDRHKDAGIDRGAGQIGHREKGRNHLGGTEPGDRNAGGNRERLQHRGCRHQDLHPLDRDTALQHRRYTRKHRAIDPFADKREDQRQYACRGRNQNAERQAAGNRQNLPRAKMSDAAARIRQEPPFAAEQPVEFGQWFRRCGQRVVHGAAGSGLRVPAFLVKGC
jgi:hypothetical protein